MKHQYIIWILLTCLLYLSGCAKSPHPAEVSFAVFGEPAEFAAYEELVAAFETQHPEIDIIIRHTPGQSEYRRKLAAEFSSGNPSDVILLNNRRFANFAETGSLEVLEPYLQSSAVIQPADFYPVTLESFTYQDQLWCIPQNLSSLVVYYNKTLYDRNEIPYPDDHWTWDDFLNTAQQLTQDTTGDGKIDQYGAGISPNLFRLAPFVWQNGGELVDDSTTPRSITLDSPASREAFEWFVNLQVLEQVVPNAVAESALSSEERFLTGSLGMYFNSRRGVPLYRTIQSFDWDVAPLPQQETQAGILHSDAYCMAASAENKEAAWKFIEFANSIPGQQIVARSGRTVPSLLSVAESKYFLTPDLPPANSHIFIENTESIRLVPILSTWVRIEETTSQEIERAFYGDISIDQAIQNIQEVSHPFFESLLK